MEWENFTILEIVDPNFRWYWSVRGQGSALVATPKRKYCQFQIELNFKLALPWSVQQAWVGLGLCIGSYSSDMGMAVEFNGLFTCTSEVHQQECLNAIQAIGACFRNELGLMEDLRWMNAAKSSSLFYFMVDSTSVNWSFPSARVAGFQCLWKLTRFKHDKWRGISDRRRRVDIFPGGTFEMPVGFWGQRY